MNKIGPAFHESISHGKVKSAKDRRNLLPPELLNLVPLVVLIIVFSLLLVRLFYLQVLRGGYYTQLANNNRLRSTLVPAPRGIIFDDQGRPLVSNSPAFELLKNGKVQWIDSGQALSLIAQGKKVQSDIQRNYLYNDAFAHVLGYVGQISADEVMLPQFSGYGVSDFVGKMGLEQEYESELHGTNGKELYEVDATGKKVRSLGEDQAIPGQDLHTTLDVNIQSSVVKAMKDVPKGAVVVSDPRDGSIRAIYSKPSFDPNIFTHTNSYHAMGEYHSVGQILSDTSNQPLLDRAISGVYPPGSTYKLVTSTAALQTGAITQDTKFDDTGILRIGAFSFANWYYTDYGKKEGWINITTAIKRSNDIFFYKTAEATGIENMALWSKKMGMGEPLGIDLPGEASGTVPDKSWKEKMIGEPWYLGDTYNMGIGQGYVLATPLQVNFWTSLFANGGVLYQPHLLQGKTKVIRKDFIKPENIALVRQGMKEACETGGVGWTFFNFKVKNDKLPIDGVNYIHDASDGAKMTRVAVGCKTGTAEVGGAETKPDAWMTVFAPYQNPEIVVTVLVENSGEGSNVAGPVATQILTDYFENKK